jgi:gas vesicle structural protein
MSILSTRMFPPGFVEFAAFGGLPHGGAIDIYVSVSLVGIELLTVDARIVITSVDTDRRLAEAVNRLDLTETGNKGLTELIVDTTQGAAKRKTARAIDA